MELNIVSRLAVSFVISFEANFRRIKVFLSKKSECSIKRVPRGEESDLRPHALDAISKLIHQTSFKV